MWHPLLRYTYLYNNIHENTELHKMRFYSMNIKEFTQVKGSHSLHYYKYNLLEIFSARNIMHLKQKLMPQCLILEHCVSSSSNMRFSIHIHLTICSHKHKVRDHHRIQTQTSHRKWVITFLTNREKPDNIKV